MNDQDLVTEVAWALNQELTRQDADHLLLRALQEQGSVINCDELAKVAIDKYLDIQQRLVKAKLQEMNAETEEDDYGTEERPT